MPQELPPGTIELLVRVDREIATGDEFVAWAMQALVDGFDSPALRRLAGLVAPARFEARRLFEAAAAELTLILPASRDQILRAYLRVLAQALLDGADADGVLTTVHREILNPLNHPPDLMPWCFLSEHLHPDTFVDLTPAEVVEHARTLARKTLP